MLLLIALFAYAEINVNVTEGKEIEIAYEINTTIQLEPEEKWTFFAFKPYFQKKRELKVAVLISKQRFFKYVPQLLNSINAYLIKKNLDYEIKLFDLNEQNREEIEVELESMKKEFKYIFTFFVDPKSVSLIEEMTDNYFFIPTLHKSEVNTTKRHIYFSGIDYKKQITILNELVFGKTVLFESESLLSQKLTQYEEEVLLKDYVIKDFSKTNFKSNLYDQATLFINTDAVKSAQILSNLRFYSKTPKVILSTQINYNPLIFTLTQKEDIKNIVIANSILHSDDIIQDNNALLGSDLQYNWLNYASSILLNRAFNIEFETNPYYVNDFNLYLFNNQIDYKVKLFEIKNNVFKEIPALF